MTNEQELIKKAIEQLNKAIAYIAATNVRIKKHQQQIDEIKKDIRDFTEATTQAIENTSKAVEQLIRERTIISKSDTEKEIEDKIGVLEGQHLDHNDRMSKLSDRIGKTEEGIKSLLKLLKGVK